MQNRVHHSQNVHRLFGVRFGVKPPTLPSPPPSPRADVEFSVACSPWENGAITPLTKGNTGNEYRSSIHYREHASCFRVCVLIHTKCNDTNRTRNYTFCALRRKQRWDLAR